ncbi:MAG TPA: GDP-mannose 4,6-dehydratase [Streptosporangiaceae bacterium]
MLLTGAGGFIGSHVLRHVLTETEWDVVATDSFRHKGKTDRIIEATGDFNGRASHMQVVTHDLTAPFSPQTQARIGDVDFIIAMASESHVDRSIDEPVPFIRNNVDVILSTLEFARQVNPAHIIVISTDEVYGPVGRDEAHAEWAPILPSNPYAASKAAQEAIAISYWRTYGLPLTIVNCMNLIGEMQDREKYLPKTIATVRDGATLPVHGRPGDIGSRHYLHARNLADALLFILRNLSAARFPGAGRPDRYNIAGPDRVSNLELAQMVADVVGKPLRYDLVDFHSTRPGHDPHYGLDPSKLTGLGWKPPVPFRESLARTVQWTLQHPEWLLP